MYTGGTEQEDFTGLLEWQLSSSELQLSTYRWVKFCEFNTLKQKNQRVGLSFTVWRCSWRKGSLKPVLSFTELPCEQWANRLDVFSCPCGSCSFGPFQQPPKSLFKPGFFWAHSPVPVSCAQAGSGWCSQEGQRAAPVWASASPSLHGQQRYTAMLKIFSI